MNGKQMNGNQKFVKDSRPQRGLSACLIPPGLVDDLKDNQT
jgi:hypothetical protein